MNKKTDQQIMEEELLLPPRQGRYDEFVPRRRTAKTQIRGLRDGGRRLFKGIDEAYKIPDKITKGLSDFCKSLSKSFGNK